MNSKAEQAKPKEAMIRLINGDALHGNIVSFSPDDNCIQFRIKNNQTAGKVKILPVNEVAYIAFIRTSASSMATSRLPEMKSMYIYTVTGEIFDAYVLNLSMHPSGFYAFEPATDSRKRAANHPGASKGKAQTTVIKSPEKYEYIYFFHHGVRTHEDKSPIGKLLVAEKFVSEDDLQRSLKLQKEKRKTPIGHILVENFGIDSRQVNSALQQQKRKRKKLGEILLDAGLVKPEDIDKALSIQTEQQGKRLGDILVEIGCVSEKSLLLALAAKFHLPIVDLNNHPIDPDAIYEVDTSLIMKFQWLPIAADAETLTVAVSDPLDMEAYDAFRFSANKHIREVLVLPSQLWRYIEETLATSVEDESEKLLIDLNMQKGDVGTEGQPNEVELMKNAGATPVVQLVNKIIAGGLRKGASDIHLLPQATHLTLAYRINGDILRDTKIQKEIQQHVISRIKIISGMDISEHRLPQDGRLVVQYKKRPVELRVSVIPNIHGESVVMRILNKEVNVDIETLGLRKEDCQRISRIIQKPHGLILATGPTGSGKSTTLFALVKSLTNSPTHIVTIEDPVEAEIPGVNQIQVKPKIGLDFARILRNILRHDPDIIMLGEIRDHDTAEIAMRAALTGHLLLSTLHTNTAVDTVVRLVDMGIPSYLLAQGLLAVISQNLIKSLCPSCRKVVNVSQPTAVLLNDLDMPVPEQLFCATGCSKCSQTGYSGRCVAYELLEIDESLAQAIHDGVIGQELQHIAVEAGMYPKKQHVLDLARDGTISADDMMRFLL